MVRLSDSELTAVLTAARPLPRHLRAAFLQQVAAELAGLAAVGPGAVHRVCREIAKRYFDPPNLDGDAA